MQIISFRSDLDIAKSNIDYERPMEGLLSPSLGESRVPPGVADDAAAAPDHQFHGLMGVAKGPGVNPDEDHHYHH